MRALFAKGELHKAPVDINDLIVDAMRILQPEFDSHKVEARLTLNSALPPVSGHRGQLQELMVNLIHNALEAMASADGQHVLNIRADRTAAGGAAIAVEDTGPGISPENAEGIFDAFVSTKPNGMGLGLAICRLIVERHHGELSFSPANPRGAIFRVVLPRSHLAR